MRGLSLLLLVLLLQGCAGQTAPAPANKTADTLKRARLHTELGSGYYEQNSLAIALQEFTEAVGIDPDYAPAYIGLGLVYTRLGDDAKAESNLKRATELEPNNPEARNNYGTFLCGRNRIDESLGEFRAAAGNPLYSTPENAYLNIGICSLKKGDAAGAEAAFLKALEYQPLSPQASYQLARINYQRADYVAARNYLRRGMINANPSPQALALAIEIERAAGDSTAAAGFETQLKQNFPDSEQARALSSGRQGDR